MDKLLCPTCNENIDENTIRKLLTEEEFQKYQILITKIKGLKNKEYIPVHIQIVLGGLKNDNYW